MGRKEDEVFERFSSRSFHRQARRSLGVCAFPAIVEKPVYVIGNSSGGGVIYVLCIMRYLWLWFAPRDL